MSRAAAWRRLSRREAAEVGSDTSLNPFPTASSGEQAALVALALPLGYLDRVTRLRRREEAAMALVERHRGCPRGVAAARRFRVRLTRIPLGIPAAFGGGHWNDPDMNADSR